MKQIPARGMRWSVPGLRQNREAHGAPGDESSEVHQHRDHHHFFRFRYRIVCDRNGSDPVRYIHKNEGTKGARDLRRLQLTLNSRVNSYQCTV